MDLVEVPWRARCIACPDGQCRVAVPQAPRFGDGKRIVSLVVSSLFLYQKKAPVPLGRLQKSSINCGGLFLCREQQAVERYSQVF